MEAQLKEIRRYITLDGKIPFAEWGLIRYEIEKPKLKSGRGLSASAWAIWEIIGQLGKVYLNSGLTTVLVTECTLDK
jgi:hypothetical protein